MKEKNEMDRPDEVLAREMAEFCEQRVRRGASCYKHSQMFVTVFNIVVVVLLNSPLSKMWR